MNADRSTPRRSRIVVGFDGSAGASAALEWAAGAAADRRCDLEVVTALPLADGWSVPIGLALAVVPARPRHRTDARVEDARQLAAKYLPDDAVTLTEVAGAAVATLVHASEEARLLVVGNRGHGAFGSVVLGSVSASVARHAYCPVTVVRGAVDEPDRRRPVTVGVDYLQPSGAAVRFAADQAARWGVPLRVVSAWALLNQGAAGLAHQPPGETNEWALTRFGMARGAALDAAGLARQVAHDLVVEIVTPEAPAAPTLEEDSRRSGLVVLGSRRLGPLERMVLGSVSRAVLNHASCPVTVVPGTGVPSPVRP
ncbi:universal stress protein [Intrasporangium flavum]|uniref:universal stress protein n=1 Tax=Intrasporangium flavum TaxID=1428657 RepID=UPI00096FEF58|nr:universal stress protein [Intrasporangium flavum]